MYYAIKAVFNRQTRKYEVDYREGDHGIVMLAQEGFYVTDSMPAMLGLVVAGSCAWFNGLKPAAQECVKAWLVVQINPIVPSRNPLRRKVVSVTIEYTDDNQQRVRKTFTSQKAAKRFFAAQLEAYAEPKIVTAEAN